MNRSIASGNALAAGNPKGTGKGKKGSKGSKGKGDRSKSPRPKSPDKSKPPDGPSICKFHLQGKRASGKSCQFKHNPPCRFFNKKGGCSNGKSCTFPMSSRTLPFPPRPNRRGKLLIARDRWRMFGRTAEGGALRGLRTRPSRRPRLLPPSFPLGKLFVFRES